MIPFTHRHMSGYANQTKIEATSPTAKSKRIVYKDLLHPPKLFTPPKSRTWNQIQHLNQQMKTLSERVESVDAKCDRIIAVTQQLDKYIKDLTEQGGFYSINTNASILALLMQFDKFKRLKDENDDLRKLLAKITLAAITSTK